MSLRSFSAMIERPKRDGVARVVAVPLFEAHVLPGEVLLAAEAVVHAGVEGLPQIGIVPVGDALFPYVEGELGDGGALSRPGVEGEALRQRNAIPVAGLATVAGPARDHAGGVAHPAGRIGRKADAEVVVLPEVGVVSVAAPDVAVLEPDFEIDPTSRR